MSKISINEFIKETKGTRVDIPWAKEPSSLKGQCVSLVQAYISECLEQPAHARGNAKDWQYSYVNEGLGYIVNEAKTGDIIVFPNAGVLDGGIYGHIGIYIDGKLYDQNNYAHDNGCAGFTNIFTNDYVILRPNEEVIIDEIKYLNLSDLAESWRVYPMDVAPVVGNECFFLRPALFEGLTYTIKGYTMENVAIIETRDFGKVQIYIGKDVSNLFSITDYPIFEVVN